MVPLLVDAGPESVPALVQLLQDPNVKTRSGVASTLRHAFMLRELTAQGAEKIVATQN